MIWRISSEKEKKWTATKRENKRRKSDTGETKKFF